MGAMYKNPLKVEPGETNFVADAVNSLLAGESIEVKQTPAIGCGVVYKKK